MPYTANAFRSCARRQSLRACANGGHKQMSKGLGVLLGISATMLLTVDPSEAKSFADARREREQKIQAAEAKLDLLFDQSQKEAKGSAASLTREVCKHSCGVDHDSVMLLHFT
jgi:hypothetical protein